MFLDSEDSYRGVGIYCYAFESLSNILAIYYMYFKILNPPTYFLKYNSLSWGGRYRG